MRIEYRIDNPQIVEMTKTAFLRQVRIIPSAAFYGESGFHW